MMPHRFHNQRTQWDILTKGSRDQLIEWLTWNDPNGIWSDTDSLAEDKSLISLEQAQNAMRRAISVSRLHSLKVLPVLPLDADSERCKDWLWDICFAFGLGFHLDTPASDYVSDDGTPLPTTVCDNLDKSIKRVFAVLGSVEPYDVCMDAFGAIIDSSSSD